MMVPSRHRDALILRSEGRLTLTRHPEGCLLLFPRSHWETVRAGIADWPLSAKRWQRIFLGNASDVEIDGAGRVLIAPELRDAIGLKADSKVMLLGMGSHFEIWELGAHEQQVAETLAGPFPEDLKHFKF